MYRPTPQTESPYEIGRRLNNLLKPGTVTAVRLGKPARIRVRVGENETGWLPWLAGRAGGKNGGRIWFPPVVGEQCMVISAGGELNQGIVLLGSYSDAMEQGSEQAEQYLTELGQSKIDVLPNQITMSVGSAKITMVDGAITLASGAGAVLKLTDQVYADPDVITAGRISSANHVHTGVQRGNAPTDGPK